MLSSMNQWENPENAAYLAISLRGPALGVLSNLTAEQGLDYKALYQIDLSQVQLKSRVRCLDESLPELAENIVHLTWPAYPNTAVEMIEVLAKDQFIDALYDEEIRKYALVKLNHILCDAVEAHSFVDIVVKFTDE